MPTSIIDAGINKVICTVLIAVVCGYETILALAKLLCFLSVRFCNELMI